MSSGAAEVAAAGGDSTAGCGGGVGSERGGGGEPDGFLNGVSGREGRTFGGGCFGGAGRGGERSGGGAGGGANAFCAALGRRMMRRGGPVVAAGTVRLSISPRRVTNQPVRPPRSISVSPGRAIQSLAVASIPAARRDASMNPNEPAEPWILWVSRRSVSRASRSLPAAA